LVIQPDLAPASALAPLLNGGGERGFIVVDMSDVDDFSPIEQVTLPLGPVYLVQRLDRGDHMARCFMTIGSRPRRSNGSLDARTPALWTSNGTGRDGRDNRNASSVLQVAAGEMAGGAVAADGRQRLGSPVSKAPAARSGRARILRRPSTSAQAAWPGSSAR
jgi:hypothetical protein